MQLTGYGNSPVSRGATIVRIARFGDLREKTLVFGTPASAFTKLAGGVVSLSPYPEVLHPGVTRYLRESKTRR